MGELTRGTGEEKKLVVLGMFLGIAVVVFGFANVLKLREIKQGEFFWHYSPDQKLGPGAVLKYVPETDQALVAYKRPITPNREGFVPQFEYPEQGKWNTLLLYNDFTMPTPEELVQRAELNVLSCEPEGLIDLIIKPPRPPPSARCYLRPRTTQGR